MENHFVFTILGNSIFKTSKVCSAKNDFNEENIEKKQYEQNVELIDAKELDSKGKTEDEKANTQQVFTTKSKIKKCHHYYLASQGLLIHKLSAQIAGIPEANIETLAFGKKEDFSVFDGTDGRSIIQLDLEEKIEDKGSYVEDCYRKVFITREKVGEPNLQYFNSRYMLHLLVEGKVKGHSRPQISLFLIDHDNADSFGSLTYLQIYLIFLRLNPKSLRIFNDSCHSQYMSFYINIMNNLIQRIQTANLEKTRYFSLEYLIPVVKVALASGKETEDAFDNVDELIDTFEQVEEKCGIGLLYQIYEGTHNLNEYKDILEQQPDMPLVKLSSIRFENIDCRFMFKLSELAEILEGVGVTTISQYHKFNSLLRAYFSYTENGVIFGNVMCKANVDNVRKIFKAKKDTTIKNFYQELAIIDSQSALGMINLLKLKIPEDLRVFTSAPMDGFGINFPSIRFGENSKVVIGSPAMGAFIEEVFMHSSDTPIDVDDIRKIVNCGEKDSIQPYINVFETPTYSNDHLVKFVEEKSVAEIMHKIGYIEYQLDQRDKERTRFKKGKINYQAHESYDSQILVKDPCQWSLESKNKSIREKGHHPISKEKIEKYQKKVVMSYSWDCNVFNFWLMRFKKALMKKFGLDFNPKAEVDVEKGDICTKFLHTYQPINKYLPVQTLSEMYHKLKRQIEQLLRDNEDDENEIIELIAVCFDDADRIVTPLFFPGKTKYFE